VRSTLVEVAVPDDLVADLGDLEPVAIESFGAVATQISQLW
jgi:hypothetical protein